MYKCNQCGKEFSSVPALSGHMRVHNEKIEDVCCEICGKHFIRNSYLINHKKFCNGIIERKMIKNMNKNSTQYCKYCGKECKGRNSLAQHQIRCSKNPDKIETQVVGFNEKGKVAWNKGLTKETDPRVAAYSDKVKVSLKGRVGRKHTDEEKQYLRECAIKTGLGGFNMRRQRIKYNGKSLDSSYELIVAKSLDENNVLWERCDRFEYHRPDGTLSHYTPDFYLPEYNVYLDPKNDYIISRINEKSGLSDIEKIEIASSENNIRVIILDKYNLTWDKIKALL